MFKILLAEDDRLLRQLIKKNLQNSGFEVYDCADGYEALQLMEIHDINLVVTDIMMPRLNGNELLQELKKSYKDIPVIMLTALYDIQDKALSFNSGADDYIVKPIDFEELELRIRAILRRYDKVSATKLVVGNTKLDYNTKQLIVNNQDIEVTKKEFMLLYTLMSNKGQIFSRNQLMNEIWGSNTDSYDRTVDVHINKLREKLTNSDVKIKTVRGLGYKVE